MSDKKEKSWSEVWLENYEGRSQVAKWVGSTVKDTYKGDSYIPWANAVHALYMLDPNAEIIKLQNENGGYVHTDKVYIETVVDGTETKTTVLSHMVKTQVIFMGKTFEEVYPIQEKDYAASKVYDQNKVNKALQRCLTRVISLATGIGWKYYEANDLQFDDDKSTTKPTITPTQVQTKVTPTVEGDKAPKSDDEVSELVAFMVKHKENTQVKGVVDKYNTVLSKTYKFQDKPLVIDLASDSAEILTSKLALIDKPKTMLDGLKKVVNE